MRQIGLLRAMALTRRADRMDAGQRQALQQKRLRELVAYARENSLYFARRYEGLTGNEPLSCLPVTNKKELMAHFDDWLTDRRVTREQVERFMADKSNAGKKLNGRYLVYTTSGSTGNPCIVLYDDTAVNVSSAIGVLRSFARKEDMRKFLQSGGKTMALFADEGFYLACGSVKYQLRKMPWKKAKMKTCDVRKPMRDIVDTLNAFQPSMLGSYPTALELIAAEQEKGRLRIHPALIMTGGEQLSDGVRERLSRVFGCYVQTNYSCTEGGTVACECTERHFHINDDWVILEAVDENNQPVPLGTQSSKVLLTSLANKICPIIRFEMTDRITLHHQACRCGCSRPWLTLEGRTDDILVFENGSQIAPLALYAVLKEIRGVERFQLIQHPGDRLELRLTASDRTRAFEEASQAVGRYLAQNGVQAPLYLSELPPQAHPASGKYQHVISRKRKAPTPCGGE